MKFFGGSDYGARAGDGAEFGEEGGIHGWTLREGYYGKAMSGG